MKITIFQEFDDYFLRFPKQRILDPSKLKEFADDDFKFEEISRKFSKWLENTVGKGGIARYEEFFLFPQCFQKTCTADTIGQTLCFANWVQNKGSLSMLCIALGTLIRGNTVYLFCCLQMLSICTSLRIRFGKELIKNIPLFFNSLPNDKILHP